MYKKLEISFHITDELENAIEDLMRDINEGDGSSEDCYRSEIMFWIKDMYMKDELTDTQYELLNDYYVHGGIYNQESVTG